MTTYRGHYLPVAARREVLKIYRSRRVHGEMPGFTHGPVAPVEAMWMTKNYFDGWLATAVAFEPVGRWTTQERIDQARAAAFYMEKVSDKPRDFMYRR